MSKKIPEDEGLLLRQVSEGNEEAFASLFHAYRDKLFAFILKLSDSRQMSEDIVQDVFLKIWSKRKDLSDIDNFNAYLFRMAHNHAINLLKRRSKEILIRAKRENTPSSLSCPDKQLIFNNMQDRLQSVVESLPPRQKEIYRLKREQGLKRDEIAQKLQLSPSTVKNHLRQALQTIRSEMRQYTPGIFIFLGLILLFCFF